MKQSGPNTNAAADEKSKLHRKPIVGIAGGIGSGKSVVARIFESLGAGIIDSDVLAHQELNKADIRDIIVDWWGGEILNSDGTVNRSRVGAIVFKDPTQRHRLEALLFPRLAIRRADLIADFEAQPRIKMIVLDSPLLYEVGLDRMCDAVVFVSAAEESRRERSEKARQWPAGELERREKLQQPLDLKRARADYICENNSDLGDLQKQVDHVFRKIVSAFATNAN